MVFQGLPSPAGQRKVLIIVFPLPAHVEAQLPPRDQFVEEGFRRFAHVPPSASTTCCFFGEVIQGPLLFSREVMKDLVNRDMAEMEIGGKPARTVFVRMVPVFFVAGKLFFKKPFHSFGGAAGTSTLIHNPDFMVQRKSGQGSGSPQRISGEAAGQRFKIPLRERTGALCFNLSGVRRQASLRDGRGAPCAEKS